MLPREQTSRFSTRHRIMLPAQQEPKSSPPSDVRLRSAFRLQASLSDSMMYTLMRTHIHFSFSHRLHRRRSGFQ